MTWVGWRLQRTETLIAVGILALLAALLVPTGINMAHAYHHDALGSCVLSGDFACADKIGAFRQRFQSLLSLADWFTLVPGLIGVLLAAPFAFDLEHGTYRLMWTQSITRNRWLYGKLGVALLAVLAASGALALLFTWWRTPEIKLDGRLQNGTFDTVGIVVLGYSAFAFAVAVALGAVWRRTAASLTVAFVAYFATRVLFDIKVRDHLLSPLTATWTGIPKGPGIPSFLAHARILSQSMKVAGKPFGRGVGPAIPQNAVSHAVYLPARDFWPLQLAEFGIFAGVAVLLIGFAVGWTRKRVA